MDRIGGTWKMPILWRLRDKTLRYGEIGEQLPHISDKMLSGVLRSLEAEGFITRKVYPVVPPRVEYTITRRGSRCDTHHRVGAQVRDRVNGSLGVKLGNMKIFHREGAKTRRKVKYRIQKGHAKKIFNLAPLRPRG